MYKIGLQELCQKNNWHLPTYTIDKKGPCHVPRFTATVTVHGMKFQTQEEFKTVKEGQNTVARIALDHFNAKVGLSVYKNLLQQYAQKENLNFPVYTTEAQGPPHDRRYKAKVCVDGKTYVTTESFRKLKEVEQAVAKVACDELSVEMFLLIDDLGS